jgi:type II secretory pathway component PulM
MQLPIDKLRDRWEHLAPRERTLIMALAGTAVVCVALFIAFLIRDGLSSIEARNDERRDALKALAQYRMSEAERSASTAPTVEIPREALELETYLQRIANETGIRIPGYSTQRPEMVGPFRRVSTKIVLESVSMYDLVEFLERVETDSELVVIWRMNIKQNFRDNEVLDVDMIVSTFERPGAAGEDGDGA